MQEALPLEVLYALKQARRVVEIELTDTSVVQGYIIGVDEHMNLSMEISGVAQRHLAEEEDLIDASFRRRKGLVYSSSIFSIRANALNIL
ncbi:hypothetical protein NEFER03_0023 [Nematocida sp. LUAm3]|nr:hypothetical protein NEFER03_0023 [Nematocida sp. LUAm3]KAI5173506.1 hypothetical protein NEFER02_0022 [Nematocida sp. LUAm2]KAI5176698.1 hypothetical protein NEFER01_0023 [Nematocida sp. LUAm1]